MTPSDLDRLDECAARWMGWTVTHFNESARLPEEDPSKFRWDEWRHPSDPTGVFFECPSPTRSWPDFGALLLALKDPMKYSPGLTTVVAPGPNYGKWCACLRFDCMDMVYHDDPRVALALAVEALCKGGGE